MEIYKIQGKNTVCRFVIIIILFYSYLLTYLFITRDVVTQILIYVFYLLRVI